MQMSLMTEQEIYQCIREALAEAPRNQYTSELHLQMIKYADALKHKAQWFTKSAAFDEELRQRLEALPSK